MTRVCWILLVVATSALVIGCSKKVDTPRQEIPAGGDKPAQPGRAD